MAYRPVPQSLSASSYESTSVNGSSRRRSGETRFTPNSFQYNVRVAIALVPSAILLLGVGGSTILAVLTVGLMISYILDLLQLSQGAFFGTWGTLFAVALSLVFNGSSFTSGSSGSQTLYVLSLFMSFLLLFLIGVWASLQFRWFQLENPSVVLALERLLFACTPFVAATIQTWGVASAVGMVHAHYYLMVILFEFYWLFSIPQPSSFMQKTERSYGGKIADEALIAGPLEGAFHTLFLLFLPLFFYIGVYHGRLFASIYSICDMFLLFFVPLLFLMFASTRDSLWWLTKEKDPKDLNHFRMVNSGIAIVVISLCLEIRVIFVSFGQYIYIVYPWNYVLVTIALLGFGAAVGALLSGTMTDTSGFVLLATLLQVTAICGSFVLGLPYKFFPASIVAAYYMAHFSSKKTVWSYFVFIAAASIPAMWFVVHNFYFLNVWLGGVNIQHVCKLIMGSILLGLFIPGLALLPARVHLLVPLGLIGQAALLCTAENRLYNYTHMYYFGYGDTVYPSYLVMLTSVVGMALTRRLQSEKRIGSWAAWVMFCLYGAKLSMLVVTTRNVLWASVLLLLAVSPPLVFYKDKAKGLSRMKAWQGLLHVGVVLLAVFLCRNTIFEVLQWATGRPPSDGVLLGVLVLSVGLSSSPIVTQHFSHVPLAKSMMVLVVTFGICLVYMDPPVPRGWVLSQYRHSQWAYNPDAFAIYGTTEGSQPAWPSWLLIITIMTSLAAFTSALPIQHFVELRLFYSVGVGISGGIYLCAQYFYQAPLLYGLLVGAVVCASVFLVFTHLPSASSPRFLPWVFALLEALLPLMYLVEGQVRARREGDDEKFVTSLAIEGGRISLLGLYAAIHMVIALEIKLQLATIMRDKVLDKPAAKSKIFGASRSRVVQQRRPTITNSFGVKKLAAEGAWMPAIGNFATLHCFILCLVLNVHLTGGSEHAIFLIAPILLLLNQDANLLTGFGDRQRYFPLTTVISLYLLFSGGYHLWEEVWHGYQNSGWGLETGGPGLFYAIKNALTLILTIPNHFIFNRFMWDYAQQSDFLLLLISPLNLPAAIITDISSIRILSLLGIAYAIAQYFVSRHIRIEGMRFI